MVFVARFRVYNTGGAAEFIRKGLIRERIVFSTRLWDIFDELYDEYGKPIQNGFETVCEQFGKGSISNRNIDKDRNKIVLSDSENKILNAWLEVPGFSAAPVENIAAKLRELEADPKFIRVDFYQLAITCRDCYTDDKKVAKRPSMVMRNFAKNAVKFGTDLKAEPAAEEKSVDKLLPWVKKPPSVSTKDKKAVWTRVCEIVSDGIETKEFDTWFQPTRCAGVSNGEIWIEVPSSFYAENLKMYINQIKKALVEVGLPQSVNVYFGTGG